MSFPQFHVHNSSLDLNSRRVSSMKAPHTPLQTPGAPTYKAHHDQDSFSMMCFCLFNGGVKRACGCSYGSSPSLFTCLHAPCNRRRVSNVWRSFACTARTAICIHVTFECTNAAQRHILPSPSCFESTVSECSTLYCRLHHARAPVNGWSQAYCSSSVDFEVLRKSLMPLGNSSAAVDIVILNIGECRVHQ